MTRRQIMQALAALIALPGSMACGRVGAAKSEGGLGTIGRPPAYWKPLLAPAAYAVLFEEDTEPPGSSPLGQEKRPGRFVCAACFQPLFDAATKYESGTGWPSFWQPLPGAIGTKSDRTLFMQRTEYHCARCGGHQGHVFDDGPPPTGQRYCNNGLALRFVPQGETLPALRG